MEENQGEPKSFSADQVREAMLSMKALPGSQVVEPEVIEMPDLDMPPADYLAKVMYGERYHSDELGKLMQRYVDAAQGFEERNSAMLKLLRGLLGLDDKDGMHYIKEKVSDLDLRKEFDFSFLEAAIKGVTNESGGLDHRGYGDVYEMMVNHAISMRIRLNARTMKREEKDEEPCTIDSSYRYIAYDHHSDTLDECIQHRDKERLKVFDVYIFPATQELGTMLLQSYPCLKDKKAREQATCARELSYVIVSDIAARNLSNDDLIAASKAVLAGDAPPRLKILAMMNFVAHNNTLEIGDMIAEAGPGGYHAR